MLAQIGHHGGKDQPVMFDTLPDFVSMTAS